MKTDNRQHLTTTLIRGIPCPPPRDGGKLARVFTYDDQVPGLAFVAASTGARYFALCRTLATGDFKRITVGDVTIGLDAARKLAGAMNSKIAAGIDPVAERAKLRETTKAAKEAKKNAPTFGNLWKAYDEYLEKEAKPRTRREFQRIYNADLSAWEDRALADISTTDCETLKARVSERGRYAANRTLEVVSAMFRRMGRRFGLPKAHNPAAEVERYEEKPRTRILSYEEMGAVMNAIDADENTTAADFLKMLIYTGARKSNVRTMEWNDISDAGGVHTWKLRGEVMKNGDPLKVTLTPDAVAIIDRRAKSNPVGSKYVFPANRPTQEQIDAVRDLRANGQTTRQIADAVGLSQSSVMRCIDPAYTAKADAPFGGMSKAWTRILTRAKVPHATLHDMRRTYCTNLIESGVPMPVVAAILGHRTTATTERSYINVREKTAAAAALTGGAELAAKMKAAMEAVKGKPKGKAKAG